MNCPNCGQPVPDGLAESRCPACGRPFSEPLPGGGAPPVTEPVFERVTGPGGAPTGRGTPWDRRSDMGLITAIWRTLRDSMVRPTEFFRSMPVSGPQCGPVSYALIPGTIGFGAGFFWQGLIALGMGMAGGEVNRREMGIYLLLVPFSPLIILLGLYVGTAILHFFLWMVGGARNGIGATFRVVCYANGIQILNAIPFCGGPIGAVWVLVAEVIGIREAHETTTGRALAAVLLPLAVCCGFAAIVGILAAILIPAYVSAAKGGL